MEIYKIEGRHDIEEKKEFSTLETRARVTAAAQGQATKAFALRTRENEPRGPRRASLSMPTTIRSTFVNRSRLRRKRTELRADVRYAITRRFSLYFVLFVFGFRVALASCLLSVKKTVTLVHST